MEYSRKYFQEILDYVEDLPDEIKNTIFTNGELNERDKTVSDVICHLHEWHIMLGNWYKIGMKGKMPEMPMEGYNWRDLTKVNEIIYTKYKGTEIKDAIKMFKEGHNKMMKILEDTMEKTYDNKNENIEPFIKWILSGQGQELISKAGYTPITN